MGEIFDKSLFKSPEMAKLARRDAADKTWVEQQEDKGRKQKLDFINILATQLKNQIPTDPVDVKEITQQIVMMNIFEQNLEQNKLLNINNRNGEFAYKQAMLNLLGEDKEVQVETNKFNLTADGIDLYYDLQSEGVEGKLTIADKNGQPVFEKSIDHAMGAHKFHWDGVDKYGTKLSAGSYTYSIAVRDVDGANVESRLFGRGKVTRTFFGESQDSARVEVNGSMIPLEKITDVFAPLKSNKIPAMPTGQEEVLAQMAQNIQEQLTKPVES